MNVWPRSPAIHRQLPLYRSRHGVLFEQLKYPSTAVASHRRQDRTPEVGQATKQFWIVRFGVPAKWALRPQRGELPLAESQCFREYMTSWMRHFGQENAAGRLIRIRVRRIEWGKGADQHFSPFSISEIQMPNEAYAPFIWARSRTYSSASSTSGTSTPRSRPSRSHWTSSISSSKFSDAASRRRARAPSVRSRNSAPSM